MKYISTRSAACPVTAAQAIIHGLAPDGGLYLPEVIPAFTREELMALPAMDYRDTAVLTLSKFLDFSEDEIRAAVNAAYEGFDVPEAVALRPLSHGITVLELYHGPTSAFKDMALQLLPRLLTLSLKAEGVHQQTHILTATSGDTGKAALEGFRDVPGTAITVFYPEDGVSDIQKAQMVRTRGENVRVVAVKGNFDDAQSAVKAIFADKALAARLEARGVRFSSANSINWGRLLPQIAYYVYTAAHLYAGEAISFAVPTGNFGDILAGYLAKRMGAPVGKLLCASNENRVLTDFFETGVYDRCRPFVKTASPSMDILISSNLERLLFLASDGDTELVSSLMKSLTESGRYMVPDALLSRMKEDFLAGCCGDDEASASIGRLWAEEGYLMDPHTAVGYAALCKAAPQGPWVPVSTASPFKFCGTVLKALGKDAPADGFEALTALSEATGLSVPAGLAELRDLPIRFTEVKTPAELTALW